MFEHDELAAWAALARSPGLNMTIVATAIRHLGSPAAILAACGTRPCRAPLPAAAVAYLSGPEGAPTRAERVWLESKLHRLLPFNHPRFPASLLQLPDCPIALYVSGNLDALAEPQLAIVGSRRPTPQGRENALSFAEALSERGLGITSGMAEGIDACAHRGALNVRGRPVGVLGTGVDIAYPSCNRRLYDEVAASGALVSEFSMGTPPRRTNFPRRNRLIAALGLGTLVVEAARSSGSLITARFAVSYGREVFAIPGSLHNPLSRGCHELIKSGAKLTETVADILCELNFSAFFSNDLGEGRDAHSEWPRTAGMDKDEKILLDALGFDPVQLDTLVVRTGFKPEAVSSMMLILELEGHVQAAPGGRYSRVIYRSAGGER